MITSKAVPKTNLTTAPSYSTGNLKEFATVPKESTTTTTNTNGNSSGSQGNSTVLDIKAVFRMFAKGKDHLTVQETIRILESNGFLSDDPRWAQYYQMFLTVEQIDENLFSSWFSNKMSSLSKAAQQELIIPQFDDFCKTLRELFQDCRKYKQGAKASYIPQLDRVDAEKYGLSVCTIDGQRYGVGDTNEGFCIQSTSKPLTYGIALETIGEQQVHKHVDKEPSGQAFNSMLLTRENIPYNPLINAGAIMTCSLIYRDAEPADRFEECMKWWKRLAGGFKPGFDNAVYLSERLTADRNFSLAYFMKANNAFPQNVDIVQSLEFYFQCCSIEMTTNSLAVVAATLANGGVCPLTHERVFSTQTTQNVLSLMFSCGMYDYSGQYAFTVGVPAKSGVSGNIIIVVPGVCGFCIWSPRLDKYGNSVRGIEFSKKLVERFKFHNFDSISNIDNFVKVDPRCHQKNKVYELVTVFLYSCMEGDINTLRRMVLAGYNINTMDYDRRTGLHVAASEGHYDIVQFLLENGAKPDALDRWDNTPFDDANRGQFDDVAALIQSYISRGVDPQKIINLSGEKSHYLPTSSSVSQLNTVSTNYDEVSNNSSFEYLKELKEQLEKSDEQKVSNYSH